MTPKQHAMSLLSWVRNVSEGVINLDWVVGYVRNQREHHAAGKAIDRLERITQIEVQAPEGGTGS